MSGLPEEVQAAMLYEMMNHVLRHREEEEEDDDNRVQCPVCSKFHEPREGEEEAAKKGEPASHGCLVVYIAHQCPICLEDPAGPPMIALPCGHLVCQPDFQKLGGYIGEKPSDQPNTDRRRRSSNRNNNEDPPDFISGINMMRMLGGFGGGFPPGMFPEEDSDGDVEEDDDSDDESCPPLERVGRVGNEESDDDSMPPLETVRRTGGNNNNDDDDDDDDSMPPLERMSEAVDRDNEEEEANDSDSMPPLMPRDAESDEDNSDGEDMPSLAPRSRTAPVAEPDEDSDDDMPPLAPRTGADDDADSDGDMPPLAPRSRTGNDAGADSDEEVKECPPLERPDLDSSDDASEEESDDDSLPDITAAAARNEETKQESDDDGGISEIDTNDEEDDEIPFPTLERIRGASRAPTTFSREEYLALSESQRNLKAGGAWILIPSDYNEDYSTLVYTNDVKCVHIGVFARESRLVVNNNESVLICSPKDGGANQSDVWHVTLEESERKYQVPTNAQCVSDGDGGMWALTPTGGTKELSFYGADSPTGTVVNMLPESSYLIMDPMGGVWVHVRKRGSVEMEPGLYFYAMGAGHSLISSITQDARCTTGADGVCVITTTGGKVQLSNTVLGEDARPVTLKNCAASKDIRVIPREKEEGDRALYVQCRVKNRWKLCLLDESGRFSDICDCPKDARVAGDGKGGAWIFKRTGASHQMRMLTYVTSTGATRDQGLSFPPGSKIAGL